MSAPFLGLLPRGSGGTSLPRRLSQLHPGLPGPGEQNGRVVVQRVGIALHVDDFLPLAEAPQGVVCVMSDLQVLLQAESTATEALRQSSEGSGQILLHGKAGDRDPEVAVGRPVSPRPVSSLTTPPTGTCQRGPKRGSARGDK